MDIITRNQSLLTDEQMEMRQHGIGASEIAAVCGISPWATAADVWMRKATPTRGPITAPFEGNMATRIGNAIEDSIRRLYETETGRSVIKPDITYVHPQYDYIMATPDGLIDGDSEKRGLEIKNVGARMIGAWAEGVPDYVEMQCRQNIAVLDYDRWDVAALLGGSEFKIFTIERDLDVENMMLEIAQGFWEYHILQDNPPSANSPEDDRKLFNALFPKNKNKDLKELEDAERFDLLCDKLTGLKAQEKELRTEKMHIENEIIDMIGEDYGIKSTSGKVTYGYQNGSVSYRKVAEELAGGKVPVELMDKYRSEGRRVLRFTPAK